MKGRAGGINPTRLPDVFGRGMMGERERCDAFVAVGIFPAGHAVSASVERRCRLDMVLRRVRQHRGLFRMGRYWVCWAGQDSFPALTYR